MEKMAIALDSSLSVVAAFANIDLLSEGGGNRGGEASSSSKSWSLQLPGAAPAKRTLVGLARATGDASLVRER